MNWTPIAIVVCAAVAVFVARMLTVWFYIRTLRRIEQASSDETDSKLQSLPRTPVPPLVSSLYFLCGVALIAATLWAAFTATWWAIPLGIVLWIIAHQPYRAIMQSWANMQRASEVIQDNARLRDSPAQRSSRL